MKDARSRTVAKATAELFSEALGLQGQGDLAGATRLYKEVLRRERGHLGAQMNLGVVAYAEGRNAEAQRHFEAVLAKEPDNADACYNLGKVLGASGDPHGAVERLGRAMELSPADPMTVREFAAACLAAGRPQDLIGRLEGAPAALRTEPDVAQALAEALMRQGHFDRASEVLQAVVERHPACTAACALLAKVHFCARDFDRSLAAMQRAALAQPGTAEFHRELGIIQALRGERAAAQGEFEEARRLDPALPLVVGALEPLDQKAARHWDEVKLHMYLMERMRYWACRGDWRGAVSELLILTRKHSGSSVIQLELAAAYQLDGQPKRAGTLYRQLLGVEPDCLEALVQLAAIEVQLGAFAEAERLTERIVATVPDLPEGLTLRGRALQGLGRTAEAEAWLRRAVEAAPGSREALLALGRLLLERSVPGQAVELLERAARAGAGFCGYEVLSSLAAACRAASDPARLRRVLEDAVKRGPECLTTLVELARVLLDAGLDSRALELYRRAVRLEPREPRDLVALVEAHLATGEGAEAARLAKTLRKRVPESRELRLHEAVLEAVSGRASGDSIAWQRLWREAPELASERSSFVRASLGSNERLALLRELPRMQRLFSQFPQIVSHITSLGAALTQPGTSDSIRASRRTR